MAFDSALRWYHTLLVLIGWSSPTRLVGSMAVVVIDVLVQYRAQVTFTVDQHAVDHLGAYRTDPPLGIAIRPRCLRRRLQHRDTAAAKISSKTAVNLASRSRTRKRNDAARSPRLSRDCGPAERSTRRPGGRSHPRCGRAACGLPSRTTRTGTSERSCQRGRSRTPKPLGLRSQEDAPRGGEISRCRSEAAGAQNAPHSRLADLIAEPHQFPLHAEVAPQRVLARQANDQVPDPDLPARPWPSAAMRIGPGPSQQTPVPSQRGRRPIRRAPACCQHDVRLIRA